MKSDKRLFLEIVVGIATGIFISILLWYLDDKSREEIMNMVWMFG